MLQKQYEPNLEISFCWFTKPYTEIPRFLRIFSARKSTVCKCHQTHCASMKSAITTCVTESTSYYPTCCPYFTSALFFRCGTQPKKVFLVHFLLHICIPARADSKRKFTPIPFFSKYSHSYGSSLQNIFYRITVHRKRNEFIILSGNGVDLNKHQKNSKTSTMPSKSCQVWISSTSLQSKTYIRTSNRLPNYFHFIFFFCAMATPTFYQVACLATSFSFKQMELFLFISFFFVRFLRVRFFGRTSDLIQPRVLTRAHFLFLQA